MEIRGNLQLFLNSKLRLLRSFCISQKIYWKFN
jgi:hypothetical protein